MSKKPAAKQFQCFACFEDFKNSSTFCMHPSLNVVLCTSCFTKHGGKLWHQSSYFQKPSSDDHQQFCEICADGGSMLWCDRGSCSKCYCIECLKHWFPDYHLNALLEDKETPFECFACIDTSCEKLLDLKLSFPKNQKYKEFRSKTLVFQKYQRKSVFGILNDRIKKRKREDEQFELELEKKFKLVENKNPEKITKLKEQKKAQESKIQTTKINQNASKTRSAMKITNHKVQNVQNLGFKTRDPIKPRRSPRKSSDLIEIQISSDPKEKQIRLQKMLKIDTNQNFIEPKTVPTSPNEQDNPNPMKTVNSSVTLRTKPTSEPKLEHESKMLRVPSFTYKDGRRMESYEYKTTRYLASTKSSKTVGASELFVRKQENPRTTKSPKSSSSKPAKLSTPGTNEKPSRAKKPANETVKQSRSQIKKTKTVAKRAEQIRTLSDLEQPNKKILPVVKYFAISKLQNLKESKRYQHPDLMKINNLRFDGTMAVKKNAPGFKKNQTICKYPAKLIDIRDLGTKEAINNFESLFWVYMIDGSEPNTCKKDKTGSFYYISVLVKDAAAQMVAGGCRDCSNVEFIENGKDIDMKAICQIRGGQKLFNCYGKDYWSYKTDVRDPQCPVCKKCLINNE